MRLPLETLYAYPPSGTLALAEAPDHVRAHLARGDGTGTRRTALYVHIPFCLHFCHFCGFVKERYRAPEAEAYVDALIAEIRTTATLVVDPPTVEAIYFGGGTASTLGLDQVSRILAAARDAFPLAPDAELSFEGECLSLSRPDYVEGLQELGFGRLSYGLQIVHPEARRALNLKPSLDSLARLTDRARALFADVCVDYIYAWPGLTPPAQRADLEEGVRSLAPSSFELFRFESLDASPALTAALSGEGPVTVDYRDYRDAYGTCVAALVEAGYARASYTVFRRRGAHPPADLRYYGAYYGWDGANVLGFGIGAQSFFAGLMWGTGRSADDYVRTLASGAPPWQSAAPYDPARKELITWPRRGRIPRARVDAAADPAYAARLATWIDEGAIALHGDDYVLTDAGWPAVPVLLQSFLPEGERLACEAVSRERARLRGLPE